MRKILLSLLFASLLVVGCDTTAPRVDKNIPESVQTLRETYAENLRYVGDHLTAQGATFSHEDAVRESMLDFLEKKFSAQSLAYRKASGTFDQYQSLSGKHHSSDLRLHNDLSHNVKKVVREVRAARRASDSFKEFKNALVRTRKEVLDANWNNEDREMALSYLVLMEESTDFLKEHKELITDGTSTTKGSEDEKEEGWWETWGQCAAGTIGGAGLGALNGAAAGSAIPEPVTSAIGAAAGGVFGALSGAAASC